MLLCRGVPHLCRPVNMLFPLALCAAGIFLQNVPMFRDLAVGHAENIDPDHGLRSPSDIAAMNHDIVAIGHHETGLVTEVGRQVLQYCLDRCGAVGDQRIMLPIIVAEQAIENGRIAIDKTPLMPARTNALLCSVGFDAVMAGDPPSSTGGRFAVRTAELNVT